MSGPSSRRTAVNQRLAAGFLAGLPATLREISDLLSQDGSDETVGHELSRIGATSTTLGLLDVAEAAAQAAASLEKDREGRFALAPLVRVMRTRNGLGIFAPIALIGDARVVSSVESQSDGCCEPILGFSSVDSLYEALRVDWPQAIAVPASVAHEVPALAEAFECPVYVYGASRDAGGRIAAARVGAAGFMAEPLSLAELLAQVRYSAMQHGHIRLVALVGPEDWSAEVGARLAARGFAIHTSTDVLRVSAVLHGLYPEAVVLGPADTDQQSQALTVMRQHQGRSHIALVVVGDSSLYSAGADDVLGPLDDVVARVESRLARFADFRRDRDGLTHVPNRAGVLESLQRFAAWSERHGTPMSIAIVQVEGLREADTNGREAGNACRRHLAAALERGLRRVDMVGTVGGDVFIAALVGCEKAEAIRRMNEIRVGFETRVQADRRLRDVTLSIGVADTLAGVEGLMGRAQDALEKAQGTVRF